MLDPEVTTLTPEWIPALVRPVLRYRGRLRRAGLPARQPADGPLVTQLVRPLVRAAYGWRRPEPLAGEFGCSRRFAGHCLERPCGAAAPCPRRRDLWMTGDGAGPRVPAAHRRHLGRAWLARARTRPGLPDVFQQVMDRVFTPASRRTRSYWLTRGPAEPVPCTGTTAGRRRNWARAPT